MFGWLRRWKQKGLAKRPFPEIWFKYLEEHVPFYREIPEAKREEFLTELKIFVLEKTFIPANGMEITDEVKVVIAAAAIRLILYLDISYYDRLTEIVVYPDHYRHPNDEEGVVYGEAHTWGIVVLSWAAVLHGLKNPHDGLDTATHEFAHVLDIGTGSFDGTPELRKHGDILPWATVMSQHFLKLRDHKGRKQLLRDYGSLNEAEFFAVATEAFFEKSAQMKKRAPDLYQELKRFYGWDPAPEEPAHPTKNST